MGRYVPLDEIPDLPDVLPEDIYVLSIDEIAEMATKEGNKLMYLTTFRVDEGTYTGAPHYEYFVVGSVQDPNADDQETWKASMGAKRLRKLFAMAGVPVKGGDIDEMIATATGQKITAVITQEVDDGARDPRYKGRVRNRLGSMYRYGERAPGNSTGPKAAPTSTTGSTAVAPPKASPATKSAPTAPRQGVATQEKMTTCSYCRKQVPRREYTAHLEAEHANEEEN